MAFSAIASASEPRKFSLGPLSLEIQTFSMSSADTSGTVTAQRLSSIAECVVIGGPPCVSKVISGQTVTLAFADPAAACTGYAAAAPVGTILLFGK